MYDTPPLSAQAERRSPPRLSSQKRALVDSDDDDMPAVGAQFPQHTEDLQLFKPDVAFSLAVIVPQAVAAVVSPKKKSKTGSKGTRKTTSDDTSETLADSGIFANPQPPLIPSNLKS